MSRHVFRLFISSTFGDFQAEREALRAVWKRLEAFCAARGASFQVVDLRWGIGPDQAHSHDTIQICLDEVRRCQQLSPRPNFVVLVGDRYGWRPPGVTIPDDDFTHIMATLSAADRDFLHAWYRRDTNADPVEWCLLPRTDAYRKHAAWAPVEHRLSSLLQRAARQLGLPPEDYLYSATHREIVLGLLNCENAGEHVFAFQRAIDGLPQVAKGQDLTRRFSDYLADGSSDRDAADHRQLLTGQIAANLPEPHRHHYVTAWSGAEVTPIGMDHLETLCADVEAALVKVIGGQLTELDHKTPLEMELETQELFLRDTGRLLLGRDNELRRIAAFLGRRKTPLPLLVHGPGGAGKSALIARAVLAAREAGANVVYRFIGASPRSWSPHSLLEDLIRQLAARYGLNVPEIPDSLVKLAGLFREHLALATPEQPLILFLDAIDQLGTGAPVHYADLLPRQLPPHITLVVSVLDGRDHEQLAACYPKASTIAIKPLSPTICCRILDRLLAPRRLTNNQRAALLGQARQNGRPLWLVLAAPLARKLKSWEELPELPVELNDLTRHIVAEIGRRHGTALTTAALRYLTLARFGLSETELQEVLWRDPEVRTEFDARKNPDQPEVDALPPIFWSRLYAELDPYINEYWMDGQLLHRYFHRVFGMVADEMDDETRKTLHARLADYFDDQPLYLSLQPNARKLMEQAWHLSHADRIDEARAFINDFDVAMAKCRLNRSDDWADDFRRVKGGEAPRDFRVWESFVRSNAHILRRGDDEWPAHKILLQLAIEHADDSPATIGAEKFLAEGKCDWAWLRRELRVKHAGINPCVAVMESHTGRVCGATPLFDGHLLSWSSDSTLRLWTSDGAPVAVLEGHADSVIGAMPLSDGSLLSWSMDKALCLWTSDGTPLAVLEGHTGFVSGATPLFDGRLLSWSSDGTLRLWTSDGAPLAVLEGHTGRVVGATPLFDGRLLSWSSDGTLRLWTSDGASLAVLKGHTDEIVGATPLTDAHLLSWSFDDTLRLWTSDGAPVAVLEGCVNRDFGATPLPDGRLLSRFGENALRLWTSNGTPLAVLEGHTGFVSGATPLFDGRLLSWSSDGTLRLWTSDGIPLSVLEEHAGLVLGATMLPDGHLLSWSLDGTLRLWDYQAGSSPPMLDSHASSVEGTVFLPDERLLSWSDDKTLRLWTCDGAPLAVLEGHTDSVRGATPLPDGRLLSWSDDETLRLWSSDGVPMSVQEGRVRRSFVGGRATPLPEGRLLSWSSYGTLRLWDSSGNSSTVWEDHPGLLLGVILLPDGCLLSWSMEGTPGVFIENNLRLWTDDVVLLTVMKGHTGPINGVVLLLDERLLSWSDDKTLRLWTRNGAPLAVLEGHTDSVRGATPLPDGRLLSWSEDNTLRLWTCDGTPLAIYSRKNLFSAPKKIWQAYLGKDKSNDVAGIDCIGSMAIFGYERDGSINKLYWNGASQCTAQYLYKNRRAVITQDNGQVCFLAIMNNIINSIDTA